MLAIKLSSEISSIKINELIIIVDLMIIKGTLQKKEEKGGGNTNTTARPSSPHPLAHLFTSTHSRHPRTLYQLAHAARV